MKPPEDMTDAELSEAVALEVAGWTKREPWPGCGRESWHNAHGEWQLDDQGEYDAAPEFATSADAVLPLLEGHYVWECQGGKIGGFYVGISSCEKIYEKLPEGVHEIEATGLTFARAACIALLKAKRASNG